MARRKRVLSGMRPTGRLHIGHYFGALANWIRMQEEYDCFFFVADWHALTTDYADSSLVRQSTLDIATDWLAAGLDPAKCTVFVQSRLLEHAELHLLLSMVTPLSWLERVPTYKEQLENIRDKDLHTYGFLGYPVLQAADIVMYGEPKTALLVPVGEDQVPHVELTREIVRRFNAIEGLDFKKGSEDQLRNDEAACAHLLHMIPKLPPSLSQVGGDISLYRTVLRGYAAEIGIQNFLEKAGKFRKYFSAKPALKEPEVMLTETPRIPGTDGRKMSKSYNNSIALDESDESIRTKVRGMLTDPQRVHRSDPGRPEVCPVFAWHKLFSPPETIAWSDQGCRTAAIGCIECKAAMADHLIRWIEPIRDRRREFEANPGRVGEILQEGTTRARRVARKTMGRVREAIFGAGETSKLKRGHAPAPRAATGSSSD